jgi:hypothetical protein
MKRILFLAIFTICAFPISVGAQTQCPTTAVEKQQRTSIKHKKPPAGISVSTIDLTDMFSWRLPDNLDKTTKNSNSIIDPREKKAFKITGDLWRVKFEMNDCDLHLELSKPGGNSTDRRVIVEIPANSFAGAARTRVLKKLTQMKKDHLVQGGSDLKQSARITVTGMAFFDGTHWSPNDPTSKIGNGHGTESVKTLWELHPVFKLTID